MALKIAIQKAPPGGKRNFVDACHHPDCNPEYLNRQLAKLFYGDIFEKNQEDALLFMHHQVPLAHLKQWLNIKENAGDSDRFLPPEDLMLHAEEMNQRDWHIVPLHCQDPRRAVLGHITNYCESVNSNYPIHVIEDTTLTEIGIVVIAKGDKAAFYDENYHLKKSVKDDQIMGFLRFQRSRH